jgi:hypothetical protein
VLCMKSATNPQKNESEEVKRMLKNEEKSQMFKITCLH